MNKIYKLKPVSYKKIIIKDSFWGRYQQINSKVTNPAIYQQFKKLAESMPWNSIGHLKAASQRLIFSGILT